MKMHQQSTQAFANDNRSELRKAIESDNPIEIRKWIQKNPAIVSEGGLCKVFFEDKSPFYQIPLFVTIIDHKLNAFKTLVEEGNIDLLTTDRFSRTVLDAICSCEWNEGLDYLIIHQSSIIVEIQKIHQGRNLFVLHNLACSMSNNFAENKSKLVILNKVLQLESAHILINAKLGERNFLERISDNETRKEAEKLVKNYEEKLLQTQSKEIKARQQEKNAGDSYWLLSWLSPSSWANSNQTAVASPADTQKISTNNNEKHPVRSLKNHWKNQGFFENKDTSTGLHYRGKTEKEQEQPLLDRVNPSEISAH